MKAENKIEWFSIDSKAVLFSVFGLSYYFLIAIVLFKPSFIDRINNRLLLDINFYYILFFSICLSFAWLIMNVVLTRFLLFFNQEKKVNNLTDVFINSMFYSVGYLSCALLLNYILDYDFRYFVAYAYLFLSLRIIWVILKFAFRKV